MHPERRVAERAAAICEDDVDWEDTYRDAAGRWIIRPYRTGDEEQILKLFHKVFGVERSLAHWRWKFRDNPAGRCRIRLAETSSGELVGQYAVLPVRMAWGEETVVFIQVIDVMVDAGFRRGLKRPGLFSVLADRSIADFGGPGKASVGYGFPTPDHLRIGRRVAGYIPLHPVVTLVRDLAQRRSDRLPFRSRLFRTVETDRCGDEIDALWAQVRPELPVAAIRNAQYLNWRYADCPDVRYRMIVAGHPLTGSPSGMAILRMGVRGEPVAALVDWLVSGRAAGASLALLAHCEWAAREAGMAQMQAWFPPYSRSYRLFQEMGFLPAESAYDLVALPLSSEVSLDGVKDRWYYTMGDSDIY